MMRNWKRAGIIIGGLLAGAAPLLAAARVQQTRLCEDPAIRYSESKPDDAITRLQQRIDKGEVKLQFEAGRGYLRSVLDALGVPVSSQTLVFSKTSFQRDIISPDSPRAL